MATKHSDRRAASPGFDDAPAEDPAGGLSPTRRECAADIMRVVGQIVLVERTHHLRSKGKRITDRAVKLWSRTDAYRNRVQGVLDEAMRYAYPKAGNLDDLLAHASEYMTALAEVIAAPRPVGRPPKDRGMLPLVSALVAKRTPGGPRSVGEADEWALQARVAGMKLRRFADRERANADEDRDRQAMLHALLGGSALPADSAKDRDDALRKLRWFAESDGIDPEVWLDNAVHDTEVVEQAAEAQGINGSRAALTKRLQRSRTVKRFRLP